MGELHVISTLKDKRGELAGLIEHLERQLGQHQADLIHVDAVIRLYRPGADPDWTREKQRGSGRRAGRPRWRNHPSLPSGAASRA